MKVKNKEKPIDIFDRYLNIKTPVYNKIIKSYIRQYGKEATFYVNPNMEGSENVENISNKDRDENIKELVDNYTLAYGKHNVGFDYSLLKPYSAYIIADYGDYYKHNIGADEEVSYHMQVDNVKVSRGDVISYKVQHKQVFYRITSIMDSYMEVIYRINCKLIQVKDLDRKTKYLYDIELPKDAVLL